jgi:hypothetical protein
MLPQKTKLEQHLKERYGALFSAEFDVLLYDLTSTYVEGAAVMPPAGLCRIESQSYWFGAADPLTVCGIIRRKVTVL